MTRVYIIVEGQTEEAFVRELLSPHYARIGIYFTPIIISTSPGYKGGVVSYAKVKPQLLRLCKQDSEAYVTTMFDLYALPGDFPGKSLVNYPSMGSGSQKTAFLEMQLAQDINLANFIPNLMIHEFEALLFVQPEKFGEWTDDATVVQTLSAVTQAYTTPEDINDSPQTAPSKRVLAAMSTYQKTVHGPLIACEIGLDAIRNACPHFHAWLKKLEALV
ncbi:DUF4276 family protein [Undibacterium sp. RuTC16W]|uniref:DUF4276 family protein n=1 Tax=Undibacterium sp. RuTC16W TaxID=3413048 RepID=UPI003BF3D269